MVAICTPHMRKTLHIWFLIPICLCLICLGVRVPSLSRPHAPKHHPRAVLETVHKTGQDTGASNTLVAATCQSLPALNAPELVPSTFCTKNCRYLSTILAHRGARAPPQIFRFAQLRRSGRF